MKVVCVKGQVDDRTQPLGAGLGLMSQGWVGGGGMGTPLCASCAPAAVWEDRHRAFPGHVLRSNGQRHPGRERGRGGCHTLPSAPQARETWGSQTSPRPGSQLRPVPGDSEVRTDSWATDGPPPTAGGMERGLDAFCAPSPGSPGDRPPFLPEAGAQVTCPGPSIPGLGR